MVKKIVTSLIIVLLLSLTLCSCRQRIALNGEDEVTMTNWIYTSDYGMSAILKFQDATATFNVYENDNITMSVNGYYGIKDNRITITDEKLLLDIVFKYELMGDTIKIIYDDSSIIMNKLK